MVEHVEKVSYLAFTDVANSSTSLTALAYDDSLRISPSCVITHVMHLLFPMSIPILFFIFLTPIPCVTSRKMHASIRTRSPVTRQLG